jgi:spoIIIJ-associated protein
MTNDTTEAEATVDEETSGDEAGRQQARAQAPNRVESKPTPDADRSDRDRVQPDADKDDASDSSEEDDGEVEASGSQEAPEPTEPETADADADEHDSGEEAAEADESDEGSEQETAESEETDEAEEDDADAETLDWFEGATAELLDAIQEDAEALDIDASGVEWLEGLFERMNLDVDVEADRRGARLHFDLSGPDADRLLGFGKLGPKALEGIETVLTRVFADHPESESIYLDVDGERAARKSMLQGVADDMADKAVELGETLTVSGLNSTERRIIHRQLRDYSGVDTESVGDGIFRRLKIEPT